MVQPTYKGMQAESSRASGSSGSCGGLKEDRELGWPKPSQRRGEVAQERNGNASEKRATPEQRQNKESEKLVADGAPADQIQTVWWKAECRRVAYVIFLWFCFILLTVLKNGVQAQWLGL